MNIRALIKKEPHGLVGRAYSLLEASAGESDGEAILKAASSIGDILESWQLDNATIAAGIIVPLKDDAGVRREVKTRLGDEVAFLLDGLDKLKFAESHSRGAKAENARKLIVAMSQNLRVIFVRLAEELHLMRTVGASPHEERLFRATETETIYAPLAVRLGMQNLSGELRDLAFPYLRPKEHEWLKRTVKDEYAAREMYLERLRPTIEAELKKNDLKPISIDLRAKRYYSLYEKLVRHDMDIDAVYDIVAMRIIFENVADCYAALGIVHKLYTPLPGRIKDYIARPKSNSYRSLHTTVVGPEKKAVEIQIRTKQMHEENEYGIAGHWLYVQSKHEKGNGAKRDEAALREEIGWFGQLRKWIEAYRGRGKDQGAINRNEVNFFENRIFTITPKGDVIDLTKGATPIDFAYRIHSRIGDECIGALVNGTHVPLKTTLSSGDIVEIITQKNKKPPEEWLSIAVTELARDHIKTALRKKSHNLLSRLTPTPKRKHTT